MIETFCAFLESGATTSRALVESYLERATAASGEGSRTFVPLRADAGRAEADAIDVRRCDRSGGALQGYYRFNSWTARQVEPIARSRPSLSVLCD